MRLFGSKPAKVDARTPGGSLVDPCPQQADLLRRKVRALLGHSRIGVEALNKFDEQTVGAFADDDGRPGVAALQQSLA